MASLLNHTRPPAFCPGCAYDRILAALDSAFQSMGLERHQIVMVSDIGCSGLFDTFFHTHAFHGLHGRALTYATGIKLSRPELNMVVTMGDGGLGIGGAHFLAACRRNLNLTLLVLNNFNFGMTGGQFSATTPNDAVVGSDFLNRLEKPMDVTEVAVAAGAPFQVSASAYQKDLSTVIEEALLFDGFAIVEIQGICTGRYTNRNKLSPKLIEEGLARKRSPRGPVRANARPEYGRAYRQEAARMAPAPPPATVEARYVPPEKGRHEVILLGSAGQRVITAGKLLGLAGMSAGMNVTQKNEYDITVLRGPSIAEVILSAEEIDYPAIEAPDVILAFAEEGVTRRKGLFASLDENTLVIQSVGVALPETRAKVKTVDFHAQGIKNSDWSLAGLGVMAKMNRVIGLEMLGAALKTEFKDKMLEDARTVLGKVRV